MSGLADLAADTTGADAVAWFVMAGRRKDCCCDPITDDAHTAADDADDAEVAADLTTLGITGRTSVVGRCCGFRRETDPSALTKKFKFKI